MENDTKTIDSVPPDELLDNSAIMGTITFWLWCWKWSRYWIFQEESEENCEGVFLNNFWLLFFAGDFVKIFMLVIL